jgi:hypothetical protein
MRSTADNHRPLSTKLREEAVSRPLKAIALKLFS